MERILLLGGTHEGRMLAATLAKRGGKHGDKQDASHSNDAVILSLAGVTSAPPPPIEGISQRIGGFGGAAGMAAWMKAEAITTLIDATHPYAARISANAAVAARQTGVRRLCLWRPPWRAGAGDDWQEYETWPPLIKALPDGAKVMLTAGQDGIKAFAGISRCAVVARTLSPPESMTEAEAGAESMTGGMTFIKALPAKDWQDEAALFRCYGITHLVAKNSGGMASHAKLVAARHLSLPVLFLGRPPPPPPPLFSDMDSLIKAL